MYSEIDEGEGYVGYKEALGLILKNTSPIKTERLSLASCPGYVTAEDVVALVNSPTDTVSLKDGFAVKSHNLDNASSQHPVRLKVAGSVFAGERYSGQLKEGEAVKICSGSPVPAGADAVVSGEFCSEADFEVLVRANVEIGRNIFYAGEDVKAGGLLLEKGTVLLPARLGLAAAAGISQIRVYPKPKAALVAIGDEVIAPGNRLGDGQLYASNLVSIGAWLSCFDIPYVTTISTDDAGSIKSELLGIFPQADVIVTSGAAWGSERDLIVSVLDGLGWRRLFRHVRIGPGKGIAFGIWQDKPVFCLPGGPPSNEMAFLQLALPGILRLAGLNGSPLQTFSARLTEDIKGPHPAWTEFRKAKLACHADGYYLATPYLETSRLKSMANATCLICKPEGIESLHQGQAVSVQVTIPSFASLSTP